MADKPKSEFIYYDGDFVGDLRQALRDTEEKASASFDAMLADMSLDKLHSTDNAELAKLWHARETGMTHDNLRRRAANYKKRHPKKR